MEISEKAWRGKVKRGTERLGGEAFNLSKGLEVIHAVWCSLAWFGSIRLGTEKSINKCKYYPNDQFQFSELKG